MLEKKIKYTDYNGEEREETFRFNLTKAEIAMMETGITGGLSQKLHNIVEKKNIPEIMKTFDELIKKSYGVKSPDGARFIKDEDTLKAFVESEAYSELFVELCTDANKAAAFVNGIIPKYEKSGAPNIAPVE